MRAHPALLEVVGCRSVGEYVDEQFPTWFEQRGYLGHEQLVVLHVLEQLDGDDSIEVAEQWKFIVDNVTSDHREIGQTFGSRLRIDIRLLRPRIGESGNCRPWKDLSEIQCSRTPTATSRERDRGKNQPNTVRCLRLRELQSPPKIQNGHAILQLRFLHVRIEHLDLGLSKGLFAGRIETAAVLHARTEVRPEKVGTNLVVLRVCLGSLNGHRPCAQRRHVPHLGRVRLVERRLLDHPDAVLQLAADAISDDRLRQVASVEDPVCSGMSEPLTIVWEFQFGRENVNFTVIHEKYRKV